MAKNRIEIEDFLFYEAQLLDEWKLMEWTRLFAENGTYYIPPVGYPDADHRTNLFLVSDDYDRVISRAERLLKKEAHVEYPHSTTSHMISNVRIEKIEDDIMYVRCNFITYRSKREVMDAYFGHIKYRLVEKDGEIRILEKRVILSMDSLRPHGKASIIL